MPTDRPTTDVSSWWAVRPWDRSIGVPLEHVPADTDDPRASADAVDASLRSAPVTVPADATVVDWPVRAATSFPAQDGVPPTPRVLVRNGPDLPSVVDAFRSLGRGELVVLVDGTDGPTDTVWGSDVVTIDAGSVDGRFSCFVTARHAPWSPADLVGAATAGIPIVAAVDDPTGWWMPTHGIHALRSDDDRLAWTISHVVADTPHAERMALAARRAVADRPDPATWPTRPAVERRPRIVVVNTFGAADPVNGGQRRLRHTSEALARRADVDLLVLGDTDQRRLLAPGLRQVEVARSQVHRDADRRIHDIVGVPVEDITAAALSATTPTWADAVRTHLADADLVIACHPYLTPTLPELDVPLVYDAYNVETEMKSSAFGPGVDGDWLRDRTRHAEVDSVGRADLLLTCTPDDLDGLRAMDPDAGERSGVVVPNGVDTVALPFADDDQRRRSRWEVLDLAGLEPTDRRPVLGFIGSSHPPNVAAARLLVDVARRRPGWTIVLAGSHTSNLDRSDLPANVAIVAEFDSGALFALLAGPDVLVNPMTSGGGSNLKLFEYLATGTPVVATAIGARGLPSPGDVLELAEPDPDDLVRAVESVLTADPARSAARRRAARDLVAASFDWATLGAAWADAVLDLLPDAADDAAPTRSTAAEPPVLRPVLPLSPDPAVRTMQQLGRTAAIVPPGSETTMDPSLREHLRRADATKHAGRRLPDDARLAAIKRPLIRAGGIITNEQSAFNQELLDAVERLGQLVTRQEAEIRSLRRRLEDADRGPAPSVAATTDEPATTPDGPDLDGRYQAFEDRFRGSVEDVTDDLRTYLPHLASRPHDLPAFDIGCGRGEWLGLLDAEGIVATGADLDAGAVERCRARGLSVELGDGIAALARHPDASLGIVSAFHVVEHIPIEDVHRLVAEAHRTLAPGGVLVLETPNVRNLQVGAASFWLDPTHLRPVHPDLLRFIVEHHGFDDVTLVPRHPDDVDHPTDLDPDPARNGILTEVHRLLFGAQDVGVVARR